MFDRQQTLADRVADRIDLLIDLATLGEYGLEPVPADGCCGERPARAIRSGRPSGWEAFSQARRGACRLPQRCDQSLDRFLSDEPRRHG
jgi:hypothetical protein